MGVGIRPKSSKSQQQNDVERVVSTEYRAAGAEEEEEVEALMKVTLLAAGFVIGLRGATVRLIGQATGALIRSWTETETLTDDAHLPVRLFRIQGSKSAVRDAVHVIKEAVGKYRALCECKRRGEFVQRKHLINGVEFLYQPPPKPTLPPLENNLQSTNSPPNHVWSMPQMHSPAFSCNCVGQFKHQKCLKPKDRNSICPDKNRGCSSISCSYSWPGLFHCQGFKEEEEDEETPKSINTDLHNISAEKVLPLKEKLGDLDMEDEMKKRSVDPWSRLVKEREKREMMNCCSLFSYFGPQGLPLPISPITYTSPFDFPSCEFSGGKFPSFSFASPVIGNSEREVERSLWPLNYLLF